MTTPNPAQEIFEEIRLLQTRINDLQANVQLTRSREAVEQIQTNVNGMAQRIASLRTWKGMRRHSSVPGRYCTPTCKRRSAHSQPCW